MKYTGETGRPFKIRFQEHLRKFTYWNKKMKFARHLLENRHAIGPMENVMETIHITKRGKMMDTLERFHIFRETKFNNQINDKLTVKANLIFETIVHEDPYRGHKSVRRLANNSVVKGCSLLLHDRLLLYRRSIATIHKQGSSSSIENLQLIQAIDLLPCIPQYSR
jgi:hypothetical protein